MTFVSQALEWVRALLLGLWKPGTRKCARVASPRPVGLVSAPCCTARPSPEIWGALLARLRRSGRVTVLPDVQRPHDETGALVRAYVLSAGELQHAPFVRQFKGVSR
jgi:hypothetical protein